MTLTYATSVINNRLQQVINAIDSGSSNGRVLLGTAGMAVTLSTIILTKPCATISSGILTFSGTPITDTVPATGTAASMNITNSAGSVVISSLSVNLSSLAPDVTINLQNVTAGSIITFQSGTITGH